MERFPPETSTIPLGNYGSATGVPVSQVKTAFARMRVAFVDNSGDIGSCAALVTLPVGAVSPNFI
jgi:hypothetical protein